jgi:hypothetical protein
MMYEHLQKWGPRKQEVKFFLRHEDSPAESSDPGERWINFPIHFRFIGPLRVVHSPLVWFGV